MDNKITKKRLAEMLSYDWIKFIALGLAAVFVWLMIFTFTATKITTTQSFAIFNHKSNATLTSDFYTLLNDPHVVSDNLLSPEDVRILRVEDKTIISITVPKAPPERRPVYIENDPYRGTYRRCGEGDYRCTRAEIDEMLAANTDRR